MAPRRVSMTRAASSDSSEGSNIIVSPGKANDSGSERPSASTPPTSVSDDHSMRFSKAAEETGGRSRRVRSNPNYNLKDLSDKSLPAEASSRKASGLSGRTLVNNNKRDEDDKEEDEFGDQVDKALKPDWEMHARSPKGKLPARPERKPSIKDRAKNAAGQVKCALGKRTRDMFENGKRRLGLEKEKAKEKEKKVESPQKNKLLKELDMGTGGVLDEMDLDAEFAPPTTSPRPKKRAKTDSKAPLQTMPQAKAPTGPLQKTSDGKRVKKWQTEGLYAGQEEDVDRTKVPKKLQKKRPASAMSENDAENEAGPAKKKRFMPLPMFGYLDEDKERSMRIPFDVFAPSLRKGDERPKDWTKVNKNRLIGDAREIWRDMEDPRLETSVCGCRKPAEGEIGCGYNCLNRVMQYECNSENCTLDASTCSNRPLTELGERMKKGGSYDVGVEVVKTDKRGFGVRACRSFRPGQIIMEYTGEIVTETECQRRMREIYKDKNNYYLMELEGGLVIDGTKGSMARFINHCCEPNCEVRMLKVNGTPRMAIFAGESGIMTGEELTYDYNFDNFGDARQACYCGAPSCRGFLSKRLNAAEMKKLQKEEMERKRKAAEEAHKLAIEEERKKRAKNERPAGWTGWLAVDDPEVKARLKEEKRLKEEAEKTSARAKRMASRRRGSEPAADAEPPKELKKASPKKKAKASPSRRKTVASVEEVRSHKITRNPDTDEVLIHEDDDEEEPEASRKPKQLRRTSTGSRFTEDLDLEQRPASRPGSRQSARGIIKRTAFSVKSSMDIQRNPITEDETMPLVNAALAEQLNGGEGKSTSKVTSGNGKGKKRASSVEKEAEREIPESSIGAEEDEAPVARNPKRNSLLESVSNAVKHSNKMLGRSNSTGKWKQSTLNFGKRV